MNQVFLKRAEFAQRRGKSFVILIKGDTTHFVVFIFTTDHIDITFFGEHSGSISEIIRHYQ